jgi:transcriptional regulator with XRE-family HTH domain
MQSIERVVESSQAVMDPPAEEGQGDENSVATKEKPPITHLLRRLRGTRTLRQVEAETGISNAYLSNIESGAKRPGVRILSKLAQYYHVPSQDLLKTAGLPFDENAAMLAGPASELQRIYEFVAADPDITIWRPTETPPADVQKFVVRMYEHYTGKKLL